MTQPFFLGMLAGALLGVPAYVGLCFSLRAFLREQREFAAERQRWEQERSRLLERAVPGLVLPGKPEVVSHRRHWTDADEARFERGQRPQGGA